MLLPQSAANGAQNVCREIHHGEHTLRFLFRSDSLVTMLCSYAINTGVLTR